MKNLMLKPSFIFFFSFLILLSLNAQDIDLADSTGLPGDHFSLEGTLELFKKAKSLEDFEKNINKENNHVNNLDLNEDGDIDYIRVIDNMDGDIHAIILQAPISAEESQDIAVIEIEKNGAESALLQIIGDEALYGEGAIIEPYDEVASGGKGGPNPGEMKITPVIVNVWLWPSVRFIYAPGYRVWASPWRWRLYPRWWKPWRPHPWRWYHPRTVHYRVGFRVAPTHRVVRAHRVYTPRRTSSKVVVSRTTVRRSGGAKVYRSTTVTKRTSPRGTINKTTKTTGVKAQGRRGQVSGKRTTTHVRGQNKKGRVAGKKKTTTVKARSKKGKAVGKKKTTVKRGRKRN